MTKKPRKPVSKHIHAAKGSPHLKPLDTQVGGDHYKTLTIQPVEYCQRNKLTYIESNVVKYVTRHRSKNGRQDIEKAIHNLQILLEIEYPQKP